MNPRALLVSKLGTIIVFLVSAAIAGALGWCAKNAPWLGVEQLVNAIGGQLVVTLLAMGLIREALSWVVSHWAWVNLKGVAVIQEALNDQLNTNLKTDGLLQQLTGFAINRAMPRVDLPVEEIAPRKKTRKRMPLAVWGVVLALVLCGLSGCATGADGRPRAQIVVPIPIPPDDPARQWRVILGLQPPPDFLLPVYDALSLDAPVRLGLAK